MPGEFFAASKHVPSRGSPPRIAIVAQYPLSAQGQQLGRGVSPVGYQCRLVRHVPELSFLGRETFELQLVDQTLKREGTVIEVGLCGQYRLFVPSSGTKCPDSGDLPGRVTGHESGVAA
jgi:hypothetical protein